MIYNNYKNIAAKWRMQSRKRQAIKWAKWGLFACLAWFMAYELFLYAGLDKGQNRAINEPAAYNMYCAEGQGMKIGGIYEFNGEYIKCIG